MKSEIKEYQTDKISLDKWITNNDKSIRLTNGKHIKNLPSIVCSTGFPMLTGSV